MDGNDTAPAQSVVAGIVASGGRAVADGHDVSDWEQARAIVATATSAFGRLDVVVDDAGVSRFASIDEETAEGWNRVIGINLTGSAAVSAAAAAHWRQAGPEPGRALINTTSPAGLNPLPGTPAYCASKAAVCALTMTTAADLADLGVRANAIAPIARTRMSDVPALADAMAPVDEGFDRGAPQRASAVVLHLASPACAFTGRIFGAEGDDLYVSQGFTAATHPNDGRQQWTLEGLATALADVDRQDRGYAVAR